MKMYQRYRHLSTLDTDVYVFKVTYIGRKYVKVRAAIIDRKSEYVYELKTYTIQREDFWKWKEVA